MKKIILLSLVILFLFASCGTTEVIKYVYPQIPEYTVPVPEKATLSEVPDNASVEEIINIMAINTIRLNSYADQLEIYISALLNFYNGIRSLYLDLNLGLN